MTPRNSALSALAVVAVAVAAALATWFAAHRPAVTAVAAAAPAGSSPALPEQGRDALAVAAPPALAQAASAADPGAGHCGMDQVPGPAERSADATDATDAGAAIASSRPGKPAGPDYLAAVQRIDTSLRASADPFARAVAVWIDAGDSESPAERIDQLVQLALTTVDPHVYGLAFRTCASDLADQPACARLSARQWARVDDGNAMPWLYLLEEATNAGDLSSEEEALFHIAASSRFENRMFAAPAAIGNVAVDDPKALAAGGNLAVRAFSMGAAELAPLSALTGVCRDKAHGDANRAQLCTAAATLLLDHADDTLMQSIGGAVDFMATGDPARRDRLRAERATLPVRGLAGSDHPDCDELRLGLQYFQRAAVVGEFAASRKPLAGGATP